MTPPGLAHRWRAQQHLDVEQERITLHRREPDPYRHPNPRSAQDLPRSPTQEAVDGIAFPRLGQRATWWSTPSKP